MGEIQERMTDEDGWRWYKANDQKYISVTQVLDSWVPPALKKWFIGTSKTAIDKKKTETAAQGSQIHEEARKGENNAFNELIEERGIQVLQSELMVLHHLGFAGTLDHYIKMGDKRYIVDVKTGRFGQVAAQLGAYSLAATSMGMPVDGIGVISLPRDGTKAQFFDYSENIENCQYAWCNLFDYWKFANYKKLLDWPPFKVKAVIYYKWEELSPKGNKKDKL